MENATTNTIVTIPRTNEWQNQTIWCQPDDLRDLTNALAELPQLTLRWGSTYIHVWGFAS